MDHFIKADRVIRGLVERGHRKFILYPFGEQGSLIKSILNNRYGIEETYIVDNGLVGLSSNCKIISLQDMKKLDLTDQIILLTSDNEAIYSILRYQLLQYVDIEKVVDVFSYSMYFDENVYYEKPYNSHPRLHALERAACEIYKNKVEGAIAECGVYKGGFANHMSRCMPDRKLYLFDTFSGFDKRDIDDIEEKDSGRFRKLTNLDDTSVEEALSNIAYRSNAIVRKGYFPDTAKGLEDECFAFVSLDTDLYKPILEGLKFFYPRLNPGGYIFVDDLGHKDLLGVRKAIVEFCQKEKIGYVSIYDGIDTTAVIAKPLGTNI